MKKTLIFSCLAVMLYSCDQQSGSGHIVTEKRNTGSFKGVQVDGSFDVEIKKGSNTEVTVESDDNIIKSIKTEVEGGILNITTTGSTIFSDAHFKVYITTPELNSVKSSGASEIVLKDPLKSNGKVEFEVSGAGSIKGSVDAPDVSAGISGAGEIELDGNTRNYTAEVSGSGELKSGDLKSENVDVNISGASDASVYASVSLKAEASGASTVHYKGGASVQSRTSGASEVKNDN